MCGYELPITGQNFDYKGLAYTNILLSSFRGYFLHSPCIYVYVFA